MPLVGEVVLTSFASREHIETPATKADGKRVVDILVEVDSQAAQDLGTTTVAPGIGVVDSWMRASISAV